MTPRIKRRGQSLVEFALVALVTYMLLAAILTFGQLFFTAQVVQSAANTLAREISVAEIPEEPEIEDVEDWIYPRNEDSDDIAGRKAAFASRVFDPELLIFDVDANLPAGKTLRQHIDEDWPTVNKMLSVVMINDGTYFRFPGAVRDPMGESPGFYIAQSNDGESVEWIPVVEDFSSGKFPFSPDPETGGIVAARINYPFHSASMSAMRKPEVFGDSNMGEYIEADVTEFDVAAPEPLDPRTELYGGTNGLGRQYAWGTQVRPYRHILSGQAVYRREVFIPPAQ
ncbi:TadE family protein [Blastopirellula retiformator]|uniref:TadE-like protein n=1 Tax=Blastopirellula retiformator TaxID=2527970 RepID=A0A5C5V8K1_9BACT|nr:TadE family protein [Blastopirellula retiformator]TWT34611.1 TadE-like protein [Blastopirellula retiformator]